MHIFLSISLCISFPISTHIFSIFECNWNLFIFSSNRFGHTSVSFNDSIYFYGGFNGQTKNDVVRFVPGQCRHVNDRETCISSKHGVKCVWSEKTGTCDTWSSESGKKTSLVKCLKDVSLGREAKARTRAKAVTLRQFVDFIFNFTDISFFTHCSEVCGFCVNDLWLVKIFVNSSNTTQQLLLDSLA